MDLSDQSSKVVVLIPYYNDSEGLLRSIKSISNMLAVDVLIINDGSNHPLDEVALRKALCDVHGLNVINLDQNKGIVHALNVGLKKILKSNAYAYIARLDAGDTCCPERFILQQKFLDQNPDIHLVGGFATLITMEGKELGCLKMPLDHRSIRRKCHVSSPFIHPSVMYTTKCIQEVGFYSNYQFTHDHALWFKIIRNFRTANLPKSLIYYEINPNSITMKSGRTRIIEGIKLHIREWDRHYFLLGLLGIGRKLLILLVGPQNIRRILWKNNIIRQNPNCHMHPFNDETV